MKFATKFMAASAMAATLSGCVAESSGSLNEYSDGSTQRTQLSNLPVNCTIVTQERGVVNGRYVSYGQGTASRTCVASNSPQQRISGTNPLYQTQQTIRDVTYTTQQVKQLINIFK